MMWNYFIIKEPFLIFLLYSLFPVSFSLTGLLLGEKHKCYPKSQAKLFYPHSGPEGSDSDPANGLMGTYSTRKAYLPMKGKYSWTNCQENEIIAQSPFLA